MVKKFIALFILLLISSPAFSIVIDGKHWDWENFPTYYKCRTRLFSRDRAGLDMRVIKIVTGKRHMYMLIEGRSMSGIRPDKGSGFRRTSLRISFSSLQSPLNRIRFAVDPKMPHKIKVSAPNLRSYYVGNKVDKYWGAGKYGKVYFFEVKIPIFYSSKGTHIGKLGGPLIRLSKKNGSRSALSECLINCVDIRTHRLVDTVTFYIRKSSI